MAHAKIVDVVKKLHERVREGKVQWGQTESSDVYEAAFPLYAVRVGKRRSAIPDAGPGEVDYVVAIYNAEGTLIEEIDDPGLREASSGEITGVAAYNMMKDLYESARRSAMGVDEALDSLLSELDKVEPEDLPF
jgi:hypothetical protein